MHKKVQLLVLAGVISANTVTPIAANTLQDESIKTETEFKVDSVVRAEKNQMYLSDIEYDRNKSNTEYKSITKDTNTDGNKIKLRVDGEVVEFEKGMGAHATSTLVYDVSKYKDTHTRLVSYVGVDSAQSGRGDGVAFSIYTSQDGEEWTLVKDLGVLTASKESAYIDIPLNNANYIKLYADKNGHNGNDHAVYGDAKLVKEDYSLAGTPIEGLKTVAQYDSELKANSIDENISNNKETILKRTLIKRVGYESIQRISAQSQVYSEGINYLMTNMRALEYFIMGGPVNIDGSYQKSLKSFCEIYAKYKDIMNDSSDDYFNLRLAISIALAYSRDEVVSSWIKSNKGVNPVHRYEVYQYLASSGKMDEGGQGNDHKKWSSSEFKALPIPMMRWSVDVRLSDDEILWMVDYALGEKAKGANYFDAYHYIDYIAGHNFNNPKYYDEDNREEYNNKYNFENYYNDYGTPNQQRMWMVFEEGAVCGGLTQTYSILADIFGRPSSPCGQPGHAAAATYEWNQANNRYEWVIQNDISGWVESGNQYDDRMLGWGNQWRNSWSTWTNASYTVLASDAVKDWSKYVNTHYYNLLADSYTDENKKECYKKALELQDINLDAWEGLINCYKADKNATSSQFLELAKGVISSYNYYPQTMVELLGIIDDNITDVNDIAQLDILKNNALLRASNCTPQESTNVSMTKQWAKHYLGGNQSTELATFSFDGENAGKIVLNSKYEGSSIRVRYSLDGGNNWTESNDHIITLTQDELASISADNDIKVGLVGTSDVHTIDILAGKTISNSYIHANDKENLLIGSESNLSNLEFSTDGGNTWCNYVGGLDGTRIEGNKKVKVRYKAYGQYLQSNEAIYTFTEDTDTDNRKYIPLKNVTLEGFTSQQSTSNDHAAVNFIDGNPNSAWHTAYKHEPDKFYTVSFDQERYITALEYLPGNGSNGRLRSGEILTSLDGETWEVSGTFTDIGDNKDLKDLPLSKPTKAKYVKLVATHTYGNSDGERDKYFSGKDIAFYEDTTIVEDTPTILPDDVPVQDVAPDDDNLDSDMNVKPEPIVPDNDFDSDMEVNPDEDQVVENEPTVLPDDVPVEDVKPDDDNLDSDMNVEQDIEVENEANATNKTHILKVNTKQGLDKILEWLDSNMSYDREKDVIVDVDTNTTTYKINVFHHDKTVSYVDIKVSSDDKELIEMLEQINTVLPPIEPEMPDSDFDTDMEVDPDKDQIVDDKPVTLPDDVPVEDVAPDDDNLDSDMNVTPEDPTVGDGTTNDNNTVTPSFTHDVVELVKGSGQEKTPYELIVKDVEVNKFNSFLKELREVNTVVVSISKEEDYTVYKVKFNKTARNANEEVYAIIKVENSKSELINALNEFTKETNDSNKPESDQKPVLPEIDSNIPSNPTVILTDIKGHWAEKEIQLFVDKGFVEGYENNTFKPNNSITRAEFIKLINRVFGFTEKGIEGFTDVNADDWFYDEIRIAVKAGYIKGRTSEIFDPNAAITIEEVAMILTSLMNNKDENLNKLNTFKDGDKTSEWAKSSMEGAIKAGYIKGNDKGRLNPTKKITRAEAVTMLSRINK